MDLTIAVLPVVALVVLVMLMIVFLATRYKRCPSDKILVVYGKVGVGQSARCIHGGGAFIWPLFQDYTYMSLTPLTIPIPLHQGAVAAEHPHQRAEHVHGGHQHRAGHHEQRGRAPAESERRMPSRAWRARSSSASCALPWRSLTIEQINQDREKFLDAIRRNVAPELNKIGLYLINVNITDITDESGYIESIGKKAASEAINQAKVDVADQDRKGAVGEAEAVREKTIKVAQNVAESEKGKKQAEADQRVVRAAAGDAGRRSAKPTANARHADPGGRERGRVAQGPEESRGRPARVRRSAGSRGHRRREHGQGAHRRRPMRSWPCRRRRPRSAARWRSFEAEARDPEGAGARGTCSA